jgi:hypothetical protein
MDKGMIILSKVEQAILDGAEVRDRYYRTREGG